MLIILSLLAILSQPPEGVSISWVPQRVFKAPDVTKDRTESAYIHLVPAVPDAEGWTVARLEVAVRSGPTPISRHVYEGPAVKGMVRETAPRPPEPGKGHTPFVVRVRATAPVSASMDVMDCTLFLKSPSGAERPLTVSVPIGGGGTGGGVYERKTKLVFPFRGHGVVTQGGIHNGGHSNRSGQFAVDAIGLTPMYAPQVSDAERNDAAAGWGREIIAPAAGVVVVARADRPDQPSPGNSNVVFMLPEYRAAGGGDPGNHVVIDHGNGELSMIAHLQEGSVKVREGQRVEQGEVLGLLGNSGDSSFPHVHYQLMTGPDWKTCDALPFRFENGPAVHWRGTWFEAKPNSAK